jgi:RHS repeat-associated protein
MTLFLGLTDAGAIPAQRHYLHDAHGTPVAITTEAGAIAQRSAYDVWGNPTRIETLDAGLNARPNRIGFTGYVLDLEGSRTGSGASATSNNPIGNARYYAKARYYGAGRGGFLSVDPWDGDTNTPVSLNKYLYGYANPGVYIDPDGRISFLVDRQADVARFSGGSLAMAKNAAGAMGDAPWYAKPGLALTWVAGGAGYIAGGVGEFVVGGGNLAANAIVAGTDQLGDALGVEETALSGLAREAYAETDAFIESAAPTISAFENDAVGTSSAAVIGTAAVIGEQIARASEGDSQAIFDLASNFNPRQAVRNARTAVTRHADRGGAFAVKENATGQMPDLAPAPGSSAASFTVDRRHRAGNRQVTTASGRWHVPLGADPATLPAADAVGDRLQTMARDAAARWSPEELTPNEIDAIDAAKAGGAYWRAHLLERQARGRWVESRVRRDAERELPNLEWSRVGADARDPATGLQYDILSGTRGNLDAHARRMKDETFRMVDFPPPQ